MGTHKKGPAKLISDEKTSLKSWLGDKELPYLFKILAVNRSLSIQAHPNKVLAKKLHSERPDVYKDPNHKPEMTYALTEFEAMCGFRPGDEIAAHLKLQPLRNIIGEKESTNFEAAVKKGDTNEIEKNLKVIFTNVMKADPKEIKKQIDVLLKSFENKTDYFSKLIMRLNKQFPGDVGVFAPYFLNVLTLKVGEAMFLSAGLPHAYLDGNCIEAMACSDNVIRAGLTPKLRDTNV
eukprot:UN27244